MSNVLTCKPRFMMTDRLRALADRAVQRSENAEPVQRGRHQTEAFFGRYADLPPGERMARSLTWSLNQEPVRIFPGERINGLFYGGSDPQFGMIDATTWAEHCVGPAVQRRVREELPELYALVVDKPEEPFLVNADGFPGHIGWRYDRILAHGVKGLIAAHRAAARATTDAQARAYYEGVIIAWQGVLAWNRRHCQELRHLAEQAADPAERAFMGHNLAVMQRVPYRGARNFHEALQSFYFQWLSVIYETYYGGNSPGRFDYLLWPYLRAEYEAGRLDDQQAGELVAELFIKMDERNHGQDGNVNTIVLGGLDSNGQDAVNPLTYITLDVFEQLAITHPAVYTRIAQANPPEYLDRCVDYLLHGGNRAQVLNDDAIIPAMTRNGRMPFADAAMYMCGGCMEISPQGMNSDLLFSFLINVPKILELTLTGGQCLVERRPRLGLAQALPDFADFESLYRAFHCELARICTLKFRSLDICSEEMARHRPCWLMSSMTDDCLARGRAQMDGGARYHDYGGTPLGLQNTADALTALKLALYDERICTAEELLAALAADFVGWEPLRRRLLRLPKFGQGDPVADAMMNRVVGDVCAIFDGYRNRFGGRVKPIVFTFVWAPWVGGSLGASPDGRRAGQPIGHGLTPQSAAMTEGLTTALASATGLDAEAVSGGASTMWDMDHEWINHDRLKAVLQVFLSRGGQIFQGNTTDVAHLEAALVNPEAYPNLMVRVGGFSARFISLGADCQQEIIARHRHRG